MIAQYLNNAWNLFFGVVIKIGVSTRLACLDRLLSVCALHHSTAYLLLLPSCLVLARMLSTLSRTSARLAIRQSRRHVVIASGGALNEKHTLVLIRYEVVVSLHACTFDPTDCCMFQSCFSRTLTCPRASQTLPIRLSCHMHAQQSDRNTVACSLSALCTCCWHINPSVCCVFWVVYVCGRATSNIHRSSVCFFVAL